MLFTFSLFAFHFSLFTVLSFLSSSIIAGQLYRRLAHLLGNGVSDVHAINYSYDRGLNCHFLVTHRGAGRFAEGTNHHLATSGAQPVGYDDDISRWILFQIVRMNYQKADAFKVGSLLGGPNCADDFS